MLADVGRRRRLAAVVATLGLATLFLQTAAAAHVSAANGDPYDGRNGNVQLASDVLRGINTLTPTGVYDPTGRLAIGVSLTRPNPAGEDAYLADVYNPHSPEFRRFLSVGDWQQRFGVSTERFNRAVAWLHAGGLTTTAVGGSTEYLLAQGPAALVEALFHVQVDTYSVHGTDFYANTAAPTVPANLGILDVSGLQDVAHMRTMQQLHQQAVASGAEPLKPQVRALPGPGTNIGLTTPQDLWSIYDQPSTDRGLGESMAIFGWGCTDPTDSPSTQCASTNIVADLRTDETQNMLPQTPIQITYFGQAGDTITDTSGTGEWDLDLPASTGMAPDATVEHLYFGENGQDPDILAAYAGWDGDPNAPRQGSSSFAGCEATPATGSLPGGPGNPTQGPGGFIVGNPNQDGYEALLKEAVELGHTMFNSAGDLGANGCAYNVNTALNGVTPSFSTINNYPSSSTWVTTVGGTVLYWNGSGSTATRALEYSWPYSGGGTSLYIAAPPWQTGAFQTDTTSSPGLAYLCTTDWHNPPNPYTNQPTYCRGLPDIAAQSGDVVSNGYFAGGGTSLSSPLWLGMWTRIQAASSNPGRLGFASPAIYANNADPTRYANDFFDIGQAGNTGTAPSCDPNPGPYSCSHTGWDYASGWGTPDITHLMKDLDGGNTSPVAFIPAQVPEAPASALLLLAAAGVVGTTVVVRRRRRARVDT